MKRKLSLLAMLATIVLVVAVTIGYSASGQTKKFPKKARITVPYTLDPGAYIFLPEIPWDVPVTIEGICTTSGAQGIGQAKIYRVAGSENFFTWVGSDITSTAVKSGYVSEPGQILVSFDVSGSVGIVALTSQFLGVTNGGETEKTGVLTISW